MILARLTLANLKMIVRNRQSLFWALAFPLLMVVLFGLIASQIDSRAPEGSFVEGDYKSFIVSGMAIWGIMSFSVIGMATSMAGYREKKIFRRIKATPLKARTFFTAQVIAYLALSMVQAAIIMGVGALAFGVSISGNILIIGLVIAVGNVIFLNLGFLVGAYSKTVAAASGLGNLVVLPMLMTSGIFFPADYLPDALVSVVRYLPVYPMAEAVRGVTLDAMGVFDFPVEFGVMGAWIAATFLAATRLFKFE